MWCVQIRLHVSVAFLKYSTVAVNIYTAGRVSIHSSQAHTGQVYCVESCGIYHSSLQGRLVSVNVAHGWEDGRGVSLDSPPGTCSTDQIAMKSHKKLHSLHQIVPKEYL